MRAKQWAEGVFGRPPVRTLSRGWSIVLAASDVCAGANATGVGPELGTGVGAAVPDSVLIVGAAPHDLADSIPRALLSSLVCARPGGRSAASQGPSDSEPASALGFCAACSRSRSRSHTKTGRGTKTMRDGFRVRFDAHPCLRAGKCPWPGRAHLHAGSPHCGAGRVLRLSRAKTS